MPVGRCHFDERLLLNSQVEFRFVIQVSRKPVLTSASKYRSIPDHIGISRGARYKVEWFDPFPVKNNYELCPVWRLTIALLYTKPGRGAIFLFQRQNANYWPCTSLSLNGISSPYRETQKFDSVILSSITKCAYNSQLQRTTNAERSRAASTRRSYSSRRSCNRFLAKNIRTLRCTRVLWKYHEQCVRFLTKQWVDAYSFWYKKTHILSLKTKLVCVTRT